MNAASRAWWEGRERLSVVAWRDSVVEAVGHPVRSTYVEAMWLPVLGPTALLMLRRFAAWLDTMDGPVEVDVADLAQSMGLAHHGTGPNSPVVRAADRLVRFGLAMRQGEDLAVRTALADLPARLHHHLPAQLLERAAVA